MRKTLLAFLIAAANLCAPNASAFSSFVPGEVWKDSAGQSINAHGCCVVYHEGTYYWFGEDRTGSKSNGISCYYSTDLYNWKRQGLAFKASQALDPETKNCILERPKVIYNPNTDKWVMYIHWENGNGYGEARVCVAQADRINGEYQFIATFRPNNHDSRDQTVFRDKDDKAYHFCSTDMNTNMNVALLADDYLSTANPPVEIKILNGLRYEAPAIFRVGDLYYGLFSGCTGWDPNPGHTATADAVMGEWVPGRNFAIDKGCETTYRSQSTYVLKVEGYENAYIYMGDRWYSSDVGGRSGYVWLPLSIRSGLPTVKWIDSWKLDVFADADRFKRIAAPADGAKILLLDKYSDRWMSSKGNGFFITDDNDDQNSLFTLEATENPYCWRLKEEKSGKYLSSLTGTLMLSPDTGTKNLIWRLELEEDGCYRVQNTSDSKYLTVSGASPLAGTTIFMSTAGDDKSQSFGLYFDSRANQYEVADMFSAEYRSANRVKMAEQETYEYEAGINNVIDGGFNIIIEENCLFLYSDSEQSVTVTLYNATGIKIASAAYSLSLGKNAADITSGIPAGIYLLEVTAGSGRSVKKFIKK